MTYHTETSRITCEEHAGEWVKIWIFIGATQNVLLRIHEQTRASLGTGLYINRVAQNVSHTGFLTNRPKRA